MTRTELLGACVVPVCVMATAAPASASAQDVVAGGAADRGIAAPARPGQGDIVVTGSIIRGTPEDAALPVDVIGAAELERRGTPTAVELFKALPTSSAVLGDANQFDSRSQGSEGIATANLRGLSPQRTLVLLNSQRLATAGNPLPTIDINLLPYAALSRIEVLKDGAAATYGSDAIAGVINFITRTDQEGLRAAGSYRAVQDTDGDVDVSLSFGHVGDGFRFLVAAGFYKRGQLLARDRDFAVQPYANNPQGGWTGGGNPATFVGVGATGVAVTGLQVDTSCAPLGGYVGANGRCYTQYSGYDVLGDLEKRGTVFVDFAVDLAPRTTLELTALYGRTEVPHFVASPSFILTQAPSIAAKGGTNPSPGVNGFYVPATNPGFIAYRAANPAALPATATGAVFPLLLFRPYLAGGNPATLDDSDLSGASRGRLTSDSVRLTAELSGQVTSGISYSLAATYHDYYRYRDGYDEFGDRVQLALRGFGGPNCNVAANTPGANGCLWLNPFGNAVTRNPVTGATNPQGNAALANSAELTNWFFLRWIAQVDTRLFVVDGSMTGDTGITLPGGTIRFGVGGQYRRTAIDTMYGVNNNLSANPCRDTPITGNTDSNACSPIATGGAPSPATGAFGFLGTQNNSSLKGSVHALFGELQIPLFDRVNVQAAIRYEDYGGGVGSTVDPQVRARWQVTGWLALRGGYGTTFRGPTLTNTAPDFITVLQLVGSTFTPVDVYGNASVKPEKARNYSAGVLLGRGRFKASVDYFRYDLTDVIVSDPLSPMVATLFPSGQANTCAANPGLAARFIFSTGSCTATTTVANIARVRTFLQNGATQGNSGLDFSADYVSSDFLGLSLRFGVGADVTYTLHNRISDIFVAGTRVARAYDGVGLLNYQSTLYPVPRWKGQGHLDLGAGPVDARLTVSYVGGLHDQRFDTRTGPFAPDTSIATPGASLLQGADLGEFITADLNVQIRVTTAVVLTGTVFNILDARPPFAREDFNYEPLIGTASGRMVKIGFASRF